MVSQYTSDPRFRADNWVRCLYVNHHKVSMHLLSFSPTHHACEFAEQIKGRCARFRFFTPPTLNTTLLSDGNMVRRISQPIDLTALVKRAFDEADQSTVEEIREDLNAPSDEEESMPLHRPATLSDSDAGDPDGETTPEVERSECPRRLPWRWIDRCTSHSRKTVHLAEKCQEACKA